MAQPANVGGDEGNYVNGGFDQGAAEARQAFPMGGFAPYQAESLQDVVDKVWGTRGGVEEFFTSAQNSQTGRGTSSGQGSQDGGGRGGESEGRERKRQGARAGGSGLYTAEDHMEMERRRGEAAQRGQGLLPGRQDSQGKGGGLPKGQTVFLVDGTAVNIDDATVEMGALGTNQIPYPDLSQRQKVVRELSVKRMRERERAGGRGRGWAPGRGKGGGKGVYEHPHARGRGRGERRGNMELCPESEKNYLVEMERTLREQEAQRRGSGAGGAEQAQSAIPGDEDGQDDRVEQERTDAQVNPGADIEMGSQAAAAARAELTEASGTPLPGGAGGGGGSESDGGEPEPKRRQTMEDVEDEAGIGMMPARSREQAREVGSDGIRKAASSGGFLKKRNAAKKKAAEAVEAAAAAAATAAAGGGGSAVGEGNTGDAHAHVHGKATMHKSMGPPPPRGKGPAEGATAAAPSSMGAGTPSGLRLPDAVAYETGIASGSEYTVESDRDTVA